MDDDDDDDDDGDFLFRRKSLRHCRLRMIITIMLGQITEHIFVI
jgi:hypothetical protein